MGLKGFFTRMMHPHVALSTKERSAVLARMHASNTASLVDQQLAGRAIEDYQKAVARIRLKLGDAGKQKGAGSDPALVLLSQIIDMLRNARLTINFKPAKWFRNEVKFEKYGGMFEVGYNHRDNYAIDRDNAEMNMFNYGGRSGPLAADMKKLGVADVKNVSTTDVRDYSPTNPDFLGGMRPKYAAVDYNFAVNGGAAHPRYGKSFFVLKEHVKMNATFTPNDSLHEKDSSRLANLHNMFPLVATAEDGILDKYIKCALGQFQKGTLILPYTEAQLHSDITFRDDVACVVVQDLSKCDQAVQKNFAKFLQRFGLRSDTCAGDASADT